MKQIYFLSVEDLRKSQGLVFHAPPLRFSKETGFKSLLIPSLPEVSTNYSFNEPRVQEPDPLIEDLTKVLGHAIYFPLRTLKNLKIEKNSNEYLVYSVNNKHLAQGWFGVAILDLVEKDLPLKKKDAHLIENVFDFIAEELSINDYHYGGLAETFSNYCTDHVSEVLEGMWRENSLEQVITPKPGDSTKWDLFIQSIDGMPLTNIVRFDSRDKEVTSLDMNRKVNINDQSETISNIHLINCMNMGLCYRNCKENFGKLTHLSSILSNSKGYGFTFIDELNFTDRNFMKPTTNSYLLNMDVKNRQRGKNKYIDKLYGNERKALNMITHELKSNKHFNQLINSYHNNKDVGLEIELKRAVYHVIDELF